MTNIIDENKLLKYGFNKDKNKYLYEKRLNDNLLLKVTIINNNIETDVYDEFGKFLPFYIKNNSGSYISDVKNKVENIKKDILNICFTNNNVKDKLLKYVKDKYNTIPIYPWNKYPDYFTLTKNKKWYGIVMNINASLLGLDSNDIVNIINIKMSPIKIESLIDNKTFFKAYHMNKKYWITILLDNIDFELLKDLIDESYLNVKKI